MTVLTSPDLDSTVSPLSVAMRDGSRAEHTAAEGSSFMTELLGERLNEVGYLTYLRRLRPVYSALETTGRELAGGAVADAVWDPRLERLDAIDADLAYWETRATATNDLPGASTTQDSPATRAYVERVEAAAGDPLLFVAHHYTRYLGDLSGGQAIGRILSRAYGLLDGVGVAFYDFSALGKPKPYKDAYRARLDALDLDEAAKERVVEEVRATFGLNQALFVELSADIERFRR